ncbi:A24 family peptidase [Acidocella sp.]|uniref:A24 family peptidase n=1 Tax=Acidocella sp. TaxID=50710 RepID=UPI003CFC2CAF
MTLLLASLSLFLLLYAALHDFAARTVPNWVSGGVFLCGVALRGLDHNLLPSLGAAAIIFILLFGIWAAGLMGGGDVKLWAASSLLIQPSWQMELLSVAHVMLLGGGLAIFYLLLSFLVRRPVVSNAGSCLRRCLRAEQWRVARRGPLPYAVAISGGTLMVMLPRVLQS